MFTTSSAVIPNFSESISTTGTLASINCLSSSALAVPLANICPIASDILSKFSGLPNALVASPIVFITYDKFSNLNPYASNVLADCDACSNVNTVLAAYFCRYSIISFDSSTEPVNCSNAIAFVSTLLCISHILPTTSCIAFKAL